MRGWHANHVTSHHYSLRNASMGTQRAARTAGTRAATFVTNTRSVSDPTILRRSLGEALSRQALSIIVNARNAGTPSATPSTTTTILEHLLR